MKEKTEASTPSTPMIIRARRSGHCPPTTTANYLLPCLAMFDLAPIEDADLSRVDSLSCRWRAVVIAMAVHSSGSVSSSRLLNSESDCTHIYPLPGHSSASADRKEG